MGIIPKTKRDSPYWLGLFKSELIIGSCIFSPTLTLPKSGFRLGKNVAK